VVSSGTSVHLIVVDFNSQDYDEEEFMQRKDLPITVQKLYLPFSRMMGLHVGMKTVELLANGNENAKVFIMDTSVVIPEGFISYIRQNLICGSTVLYPVLRKFLAVKDDNEALAMKWNSTRIHNESEFRWTWSGYGLVGFCSQDYIEMRGFEFKYGFKWGAEDLDMSRSLKGLNHVVIRQPIQGLLHSQCRSKTHLKYRSQVNLYEDKIPAFTDAKSLDIHGPMGLKIRKFLFAEDPNFEIESLVYIFADQDEKIARFIVAGEQKFERKAKYYIIEDAFASYLQRLDVKLREKVIHTDVLV